MQHKQIPVLPQLRAVGLGFLAVLAVIITMANVTQTQAAGPLSAPTDLSLSLQPFASGLSEPVSLASAGDDRLFVLEKAGVIKVIQPNGDVLPTPFLDITDRVDSSETEEGLLGLAFHPDYSTNGYFYVNYVNTITDVRRTRIARFSVTTDTNVADPNSEEILLTVDQPFRNHNAGDIHFGPDDLLYIPLGDGGDSNDPQNNAQTLDQLLGKIVRINVDSDSGTSADCFGLGTGNYTVPADNPYVDGSGNQCDEIWASGFRNPWRSSFDRQTGDLYLGDVGQGAWEEVDLYPAGEAGGLNFGWRCYEGNHDNVTTGCGPLSSYTAPIFEYSSSDGTGNCSVIGGYVYRGSQYPAMVGHYLLADYCSGRVWDLVKNGDTWQATEHTNIPNDSYVAFGEDAAGELYLVSRNGTVYAIQEDSLLLSIHKSGPSTILPGDPLTYTLSITNSSLMTATNLVITDALPAGANYLPGSGGTLVGDVVSWTIPSLAGGTMTQTTFAVTTTETISNSDYRVSADGDQSAVGTETVLTVAVDVWNYLPLITK